MKHEIMNGRKDREETFDKAMKKFDTFNFKELSSVWRLLIDLTDSNHEKRASSYFD